MPRKTSAPATTDVVEPTSVVSTSAEAIQAVFPVAAPATKTRAAKLTLSQRRALLRLADEEIVTPGSAFRALPLEYLASVGLAETGPGEDAGSYRLTDAGRERAASINPAYRDWRAGGSVVGGTYTPDRLGSARRAVEDARFDALANAANAAVGR